MKKITLLLFLALIYSTTSFTQIQFTDQTSLLLSDTTVYSGVAMGIADMNGDSLDDIIRLNNGNVLQVEYQQADGSQFGTLFHGLVGVSSQWSMCVADVDSNGYNDIMVGGRYDDLKLLKANSNGTSYSQTKIDNPSIFLQGSNFVDIDNNGTIDLFACHDDGLSAPFSNDGLGNFSYALYLIDASSTVPSNNSGNYASIWTDYDNDGDLDLYISKCRFGVSDPDDGRRLNLLFQNNGGGFTDVAASAGLQPKGQSWAADFADIDNDGDLDCFLINHDIGCLLYQNNGDGTFTDFTASSGISSELASLSGGVQCNFDDFDNDGFVDLLVTSAFNEHGLFYNNGDLTFDQVIDPFANSSGIQSAVTGDLNADGFLDVYMGFANGYNTPISTSPDKVFINEGVGANYLKLSLKGTNGNSNAIGARAEIYGSWGIQVREVRSGEGYGIMNSYVLHFGLGNATEIDSIKIRWPDGMEEKMCGINANKAMFLEQGNLPDLLESNFTFSDIGQQVSFIEDSEGLVDYWNWDFGDGSTSTDPNPVHLFATEGPYTVTLTVGNDCETKVYSEVWQIISVPLSLKSFAASLLSENQVKINWQTESEIQFDYFELQKKKEGNDSELLTRIPGENNQGIHDYQWIDKTPHRGANYYRLKMVNEDGSFTFSDWKVATVGILEQVIKVFPNPVTDQLFIDAGAIPLVAYELYNATGQLMLQGSEVLADAGVDLSGLETGVYFLRLELEGEWRFFRVAKL